MKSHLTLLTLLVISITSYSQSYWQDNYGKTFSLGVEIIQRNHEVNHKFEFNNNLDFDTTLSYGISSILPYYKKMINLGSIQEDDLFYLNLIYGINLHYNSTINGEAVKSNIAFSHNAEVGLTYLKGEEFGNAYIGSLSLNFISGSNNFGGIFFGPTLSAGYQFELSDRLFQVYAKGGVGVTRQLKKTGYIILDGNDYETSYTSKSYLFGIGIVYRGIN